MIHHNLFSIAVPVHPGSNHCSCTGTMDIKSHRTSQVNAMMGSPLPGKRIVPVPVSGCEPIRIGR